MTYQQRHLVCSLEFSLQDSKQHIADFFYTSRVDLTFDVSLLRFVESCTKAVGRSGTEIRRKVLVYTHCQGDEIKTYL
jgi:hypothetical protein